MRPPRALNLALAAARLREQPEDFVVEEDLGFAPAGEGPHLLLRVMKRDANTRYVAQQLARLACCHPRDVGYAGLKDRRAVAVQWFSVPTPRAPLAWGDRGRGHGFEVLEVHAHRRKLPRGALSGNRFAIRLRPLAGRNAVTLAAELAPGVELIRHRGVPNYFGAQRFGHDGTNLLRAEADPGTLDREERGFILSAARSALFNMVLAERVEQRTWDQLLSGDLAMLDGRGSFFAADPADEALAPRLRALDLHPSGPLWGRGQPPASGAVRVAEERCAAAVPRWRDLCESAGMEQERRALRMAVRDLELVVEESAVLLRLRLARGCFATAVLRELLQDCPATMAGD
ncbi:MAG: tRNA pseudouridine(13) synthase TruD [Proteobacteria bacterium]|nr:tRNA pseudouridine(13) synthase TruD [Pseudomonadota bacterium]